MQVRHADAVDEWLRRIASQLFQEFGVSLHGKAPKTYDVPEKVVVHVWAQELRLYAANSGADLLQQEEVAQAVGEELASDDKWQETAWLVALSMLVDFLSCCYIPPLRGGNIAALQVRGSALP